jgi:rhodanese-related sulfurtransferase
LKKILLTLLILASSLIAELKNEYLSKKLLDSKIPMVDIRTVGEWKETGIVKNSIPIEFFTEKGTYDIPSFLAKLNTKVDTSKPFALICRTGSRTKMVATFLSDTYNYQVTNVTGGIMIHQMKMTDIGLVPFK